MDWFEKYKLDFEQAIVVGVSAGLLGSVKPVPVSPGKLQKCRIGRVLGETIAVSTIMVIDYYGYMKKSTGFLRLVKEIAEEQKGKQVKMVSSTVVHFNSIRLEVVARIAPNIVAGFGDFKKAILDAREFKHNYKA